MKETSEDMAGAAADLYAADCLRVTGEGRNFTVALSGGKTPIDFFALLAVDSRLSSFAWKKTHIFWVDERCVPPEDAGSNYGNAKRVLLDHVPLDPGNIHRMPSELPPEEGAFFYERELRKFFDCETGGIPRFDLIVLGAGADGHVASLFPGYELSAEGGPLVVPVKGGQPDVWRLTLTLPVLNSAEHVIILISGHEKAPVVRALMGKSTWEPPARRIRPESGALYLVIDRAAAEFEGNGSTGLSARKEGFREN